MKSALECLACILKQGIFSAKLATENENLQFKTVKKIIEYVHSIYDLSLSPAVLSTPAYEIVKKMTGNEDPYKKLKKESTQKVKDLLKNFYEIVYSSSFPLYTAAKLCIAGNVIDFGIYSEVDILNDIKTILRKNIAINDFKIFKKIIEKKEFIVFVCDNCGEIYFDKIFASEIKKIYDKEIIFIVKSEPIINDATYTDALEAELNKVGKIVETGNGFIGLPPDTWSKEVKEIMKRDPLIISKGQGNFETLSELDKDIFFLLKAKCPIVGRELGVNEGEIVFKYKN